MHEPYIQPYIHVYKEKQFHALKNYNFGIDIQPYIHVYEEKYIHDSKDYNYGINLSLSQGFLWGKNPNVI